MKNYPQFSVSMCVYYGDDSDDFDTAISSVVNQTLKPNEIVLTVDGPIPQELEGVIAKYREKLDGGNINFIVVYLPENVGHGEARRICFNNCSHDIIALMDADDISVSYRFEKQMEYFRNNPNLSVVGGNISEFIEKPEECVGRRIVPEFDQDIKKYMKKRCPMNQVTVMFKKKDIASVGGYIDWYCEEDYYLWIRLAMAGFQFGNVQQSLVNVRVGEKMYTRRGGWKYFKSEAKLQYFMLKENLISFWRFVINVTERLVLQVLMPNWLRGFVFQKFARS